MPLDTPWTLTEAKALPTGEVFCAVRVALHHAQATLKRLRDFGLQARLGPVLVHHDVVYFLVAPHTSNEPWPDIARYCGHGTFVAVAPATPTEDGPLCWLVSPSQASGRHFTDELILRTALDVLAEQLHAGRTERADRPVM